MNILAIDPGTIQSAWLIYNADTKEPLYFNIFKNEDVLSVCEMTPCTVDRIVIEMVASYGMPVGKDVFETCVWIGRFIDRFTHNHKYALIYRKDVKMHLCNNMRAKDSNIRQAIIDRYEPIGGGATPQIGIKKQKGPLYGIKKDLWQALAVAITYSETMLKKE